MVCLESEREVRHVTVVYPALRYSTPAMEEADHVLCQLKTGGDEESQILINLSSGPV